MCKELIITHRKSCYRLILPLRHQSLKVHSRSELVPIYSLPCDDIYSMRIWRTGFKRVWYKYQIHEHRVPVRIGSATPPAGQVRFKSHFKLSTNCTIVVTRQVNFMIKKYLLSPTLICKEWGSKAWFAS